MIFFALAALFLPFVAIGILYPDDPENRRARVVRVAVTILVLSVAFGAMQTVLASGSDGSILPPASVAFMLLAALLSAVPVSAAERIADLFHPRRTLGWALGSVTACLVWAWLLDALLNGDRPASPRWAFIVEFAVSGIVAGLARYIFLPRREADVGKIFE